MQAPVDIRDTRIADVPAIADLYRAVGAASDGLARRPDEVTDDYVEAFVAESMDGGIALVAVAGHDIVAEIHAHPLGPRTLYHVLGDLTVAVHPEWQGRGLGRSLFLRLLERVEGDLQHVLRVELKSRESNARAISMYESLGFRREGRMERRIRRSDGTLEADIPMAWHRSSV